MAGVRALRKLQLGKETTKGTAVAADFIWRGMGVIKDQHEIIFPQEDVGILGGTDRSYVARYWGELSMPEVEATFEQLPHLFEAGVATEVATRDGTAGSGYIYNYKAPVTSQNTTSTYTIEGGDDQQAEEFDYCFVKSITLSGEGQGALMMAAEWFGREVTNTTFTAALAPVTVEEILVNNGYLYIDSTGGSIGGTTVSSTLFGVNLSWTTGLQEYWAVDGSLDFSLTKQTGDEIVLNLIYEHNASAVLEKAQYRDNSTRLVRLKFEGSSFTTAGTTYSKKTLIVDLAGVYEDWGTLDERDGNDVVEATIRARYSVADDLKAEVTIVNALTVLP
jgi:hypothetical protein